MTSADLTRRDITNVLRTPGIVIRVPLVLLIWALEWFLPRLEWLAENVFKGWER